MSSPLSIHSKDHPSSTAKRRSLAHCPRGNQGILVESFEKPKHRKQQVQLHVLSAAGLRLQRVSCGQGEKLLMILAIFVCTRPNHTYTYYLK